MNMREMLLSRHLLGSGGSGGSGGGVVDCFAEYPSIESTLSSLEDLKLNFVSTTEIGNRAFFDARELIHVESDKVTAVGEYAFASSGLVSVDFPCVVSVSENAFSHCERLNSVKLQSLISVADFVFESCYSLKNVDLPSATSVGIAAFRYCYNLASVILRTTETVCVCQIGALEGTPIVDGTGHIYVPSVMYENYRTCYEETLNAVIGAGAFDIIFRKIEDYPEICGS